MGRPQALPANPWGSVEPVWKTLTRQFPWVLPLQDARFSAHVGRSVWWAQNPSLPSKAPQLSDVCHLRARKDQLSVLEAVSEPSPAFRTLRKPIPRPTSLGLGNNKHYLQLEEIILLVPDIPPLAVHPFG